MKCHPPEFGCQRTGGLRDLWGRIPLACSEGLEKPKHPRNKQHHASSLKKTIKKGGGVLNHRSFYFRVISYLGNLKIIPKMGGCSYFSKVSLTSVGWVFPGRNSSNPSHRGNLNLLPGTSHIPLDRDDGFSKIEIWK